MSRDIFLPFVLRGRLVLFLIQQAFRQRCGKNSAFGKENGKYEPPTNLTLGLSRKSGRNIAWFMTGEGPEYDQETIKSSTLRIKDTAATKLNPRTSKLKEVMEYLKEHPDLLESVWQLIQGKEGLRKFEQSK